MVPVTEDEQELCLHNYSCGKQAISEVIGFRNAGHVLKESHRGWVIPVITGSSNAFRYRSNNDTLCLTETVKNAIILHIASQQRKVKYGYVNTEIPKSQ